MSKARVAVLKVVTKELSVTAAAARILHDAGLVVPEPRKRPRSSYHHFEASQPNECWQSDFTHGVWATAPTSRS